MSDQAIDEILRRGDLAVVRWRMSGRVGLLREHGGGLNPVSALDADEWRWLAVCAVPVALRELAAIRAETERAGSEPAQAALAIDA